MPSPSRRALLAAAALAFCSHAFGASDKGTPDEAMALVKRAIAFMKTNGIDKTVSEVNNPSGKFVDRDLYIMIYDMNGKNLAHGANPKMIGKDLIELKDVDGVPFIRDRIEIAKTKGSGWQNYKFTNPVTKNIEPKVLYIERSGDLIVTSGAYK
ncbi:cache domain-containing protein [Noviherbaspirillum galbum]|uniref:Histidine kinase n=1 Tax=Noviherbaspirillum galbum TaxID=2709383 RepID=A0A6B3SMZ7_9BURK|nr:cache domain-containing protein [Noviherbaspirillum galbum]NEX62057.1 histidine kinase [Noviherbaspirillum galbum]